MDEPRWARYAQVPQVFWRQLFGARLPALQPSLSTKGYSGRVLVGVGIVGLSLSGRFIHDPPAKRVDVARAFARAVRHRLSV